jgi:repressor LexA
MVHLTEIQSKVLSYILDTIQKTGLPPTLREISIHFGWKAVGSAQDVVSALRKKGALQESAKGKARQIVPNSLALQSQKRNPDLQNAKPTPLHHSQSNRNMLSAPKEMPARDPTLLYAPLLGTVQAGNPLEALDSSTRDHIPFPNVSSAPAQKYFCLTVEGYSMMNVGFLPGDVLLIESAPQAKNGDIVLASVGNNEVTVKRFALRGSHIYRQAAERISDSLMGIANLPPALLVPENNDFAPVAFGQLESDHILGLVRSLYRSEIN